MPTPGTFGTERIDHSAQGSLLPGGGVPPPYSGILKRNGIYSIKKAPFFKGAF